MCLREVLIANVAKRFTDLYLKILLDRNICMSAKDLAFAVLLVCNGAAGYVAGGAVRRRKLLGRR